MNRTFGFGKKDRLKSKKQIEELFANGRSVSSFPVRVIYLFKASDAAGSLQAGVTAGKRTFKRSVDRNRIKRLLKEAYRLQKNELKQICDYKKLNGYLFFTYTDKTIASFEVIKEAVATCLKKLNQKLINESHS
ncbi:MAG: ribonuclease P protein component [Flavisolibacter sp.]